MRGLRARVAIDDFRKDWEAALLVVADCSAVRPMLNAHKRCTDKNAATVDFSSMRTVLF
jgi:hypothetical protein